MAAARGHAVLALDLNGADGISPEKCTLGSVASLQTASCGLCQFLPPRIASLLARGTIARSPSAHPSKFLSQYQSVTWLTLAPKIVRFCSLRLANCPSIEVFFRQHPAENCIRGCSNGLFVVACRNLCVSVSVRRRGASQGRPFRSFRCQGTTKAAEGADGEGS